MAAISACFAVLNMSQWWRSPPMPKRCAFFERIQRELQTGYYGGVLRARILVIQVAQPVHQRPQNLLNVHSLVVTHIAWIARALAFDERQQHWPQAIQHI